MPLVRTESEIINLLAERSALTDSGCMQWIGSLTPEGYGALKWRPDGSLPSIAGAHRIAYHLAVSPVPLDKVIDHLCRNRACVRPSHLEVVTSRENVMRSPITLASINAGKTHCAQGHPYSPENTYVWKDTKRSTTRRICKTCTAAYSHRRYARIHGLATS